MGKFQGQGRGYNTAEVSRDIILKKLNFQGLFESFLDFSRGYERFLNQNIKAEKVCPLILILSKSKVKRPKIKQL